MKSIKANRVKMPSATSVVARSFPDNIIGIENELPWRLRTDLKQFKKRTTGHVVIMGRKTFDSIGRPLPNRVNIVLSRSKIENDSVIWANNYETALYLADVHSIILGKREFFIVGGENIYTTFEEIINKVVLTEVFSGNINGDAKFEFDYRDNKEWYAKFEEDFPQTDVDEFPFRVTIYRRRKPIHRYRLTRQKMGQENYSDLEFSAQFELLFSSEDDAPAVNERQILFDFDR